MDPLGSLFNSTWRMFRERFSEYAKILAIPAVFLVLGSIILQAGFPASLFGFLFCVAGWILSVFAGSALILSIHQKTDLNASYRGGAKFFWPIIWMSILAFLAVVGGFFMLIVPGIILAVALTFRPFTLILENRRGLDGLVQSRDYVRGYWWAVFGRALLLGLCVWLVMIVIYSPFVILLGKAAVIIYAALMFAIIPFSTIYSYTMYRNLAALKPQIAERPSVGGKTFLMVSAIVGFIAPIVLFIVLFSFLVILFTQHPELKNPNYWTATSTWQQYNATGTAPSSTATSSPLGLHCGGFIKNAPTCPAGYRCQLDVSHPDTGGICVLK